MIPSQLIVALDVRGKKEALTLVERLKTVGLRHVKVGMSLFYEVGIGLIEELKAQDLEVFVDLKLHDIPNTVARTVDVLIQGGASFLNVHCLGGLEMMQRASEQAHKSSERLGLATAKVIGVTILTSHHVEQMPVDLQTALPLKDMVLHLGVVCSPEEASLLKDALGEAFLKVTPGIRPLGYGKADDQARILTPKEALTQGATHLVVGRPIYESPEPEVVFQSILTSIS